MGRISEVLSPCDAAVVAILRRAVSASRASATRRKAFCPSRSFNSSGPAALAGFNRGAILIVVPLVGGTIGRCIIGLNTFGGPVKG